jgi:hypothetical protein
VLNIMANSTEGFKSRWASESAWGEGQAGSGEKNSSCESTELC